MMKKISNISSIGIVIFFILNLLSIFLIVDIFVGITSEIVFWILVMYVSTVYISISTVGECLIAWFIGARKIHRTDMIIRLRPLLDLLVEKSNHCNCNMSYNISIRLIDSEDVNAIAIGRKTICVTRGVFRLSDEEILGLFAHELGHIFMGHTVIQLLVGGSNFVIVVAMWLVKFSCWCATIFIGLLSFFVKKLYNKVIVFLLAMLPIALYKMWYKICMLFFTWSLRQFEYDADKYAYDIGFGNELARILDRLYECNSYEQYYNDLFSSHPCVDNRIARLQRYGATYEGY